MPDVLRPPVLRCGTSVSRDVLNPGQRRVLACAAPRIVVSAGAGSGKTRVLAERFANTVLTAEQAGVEPAIGCALLITFTDKAAGELTERVRRVFLERGRADLAREVDNAWISTIHGFCGRIVRRHAIELGIDPAFAVLADPQVSVVRREAFESATRERLAADPATERLVEAHTIATVRDSVISGYDTIRSRGAAVVDVGAPIAPDIARTLRACVAALDDALRSYAELPRSATVESNLERYGAARAFFAQHAMDVNGQMTWEEILVRSSEFMGARRGSAEMRELTEAVNAMIDEVRLDVADLLAASQGASWLALMAAYDAKYAARKQAMGALDFDDLQLLVRRLWSEQPRTAERYSRQFSEVMVDEFQDTTSLQVQAIEPVAGAGLCVVGDVQQSIYRFRDADVGVFLSQREHAASSGGDGLCELTVNYRSHPDLLATLNALFEASHLFGEHYLRLEAGAAPDDSHGMPRVEAIIVDKAGCRADEWRSAEASVLAGRLRELVDSGRAVAGDIAILVRSTKTMRPYVDALEAHGFDVFAGAAGGFYAAPEIADVRALLRVLANPLDSEGVVQLLAGGLGGLSDDALYLLSGAGTGLWEALADPRAAGLAEHDLRRAELVRDVISGARRDVGRGRLADAILDSANALGPGGGCFEHSTAWANVRKAARLAADFERMTPADPAAFLRYLEQREAFVKKEPAAGLAVEGADAVRVMTVHAAKGLEFPVVAVADLGHDVVGGSPRFLITGEDDRVAVAVRLGSQKGMPTPRSWAEASRMDRAADTLESKRVFYVACSRAQRTLLLSGAADLGKDPDSERAIDWVRAAIGDGSDIPGMTVRYVTPGGLDVVEPAAPASATAATHAQDVAMVHRRVEALPAPRELSYTALALYERCGYRFYAERVLGVRTLDLRTPDDPRGLGSALHAALETLSGGGDVGPERLAALAMYHALGPSGLRRLEAAFAAVAGSPIAALVRAGSPEVPFTLALGGVMVIGTMDLLLREGGAATVLDYKTGDVAGRGDRFEEQAGVYALALLEAGCADVEVRFVEVEAACRLTSFSFTHADRDRLAARIEGACARMVAGEYARLGAFDADTCPDCPVSGSLCPIVHPGRKRTG